MILASQRGVRLADRRSPRRRRAPGRAPAIATSFAEVHVPAFDEMTLILGPTAPLDDESARQHLERRISAHLATGRLALGITDNKFTMISVRRDRGPVYR